MTAGTDTTRTLFTIGHSDHELSAFIERASCHGITAIADVRSQPYSRLHPQFNRETLCEALRRRGISYVFLGKELGARRVEREAYRGRQAAYDLIARLPVFLEGLERVRKGMTTHRVALLCAEKDPLTCHRTILVGRHLRADSIDIAHVLDDGSLETTEQAESRLLELTGLPPRDLFLSREQLVEQAYDRQAARIAYVTADDAPERQGVRA